MAVITEQEAEQLYAAAKYRELISAWEERGRQYPDAPKDGVDVRAGWSYYQLGEYQKAEEVMLGLSSEFPQASSYWGSVWRCLAHCAERLGDLERARGRAEMLPPSRERDNLWLTIVIGQSRKGGVVPISEVMETASHALSRFPYTTTEGHILNNTAWLLYGVREQEGVKPVLPILSGLIEVAIGIYEATGTALNHQAGALFRASHVFLDVADWPKGALVVIEESIALWEQLVASEGGERYQQNLEGARKQREKILARLGS